MPSSKAIVNVRDFYYWISDREKKNLKEFRDGLEREALSSSAYQLLRLWRRRSVFEESLSKKSSLRGENGSVSTACLLFSQKHRT